MVEVISKLVVSGDTLSTMAAAESMVSEHIADLEAGWARSLLFIYLAAQFVFSSHGKLTWF